jgi:hypothetical protein
MLLRLLSISALLVGTAQADSDDHDNWVANTPREIASATLWREYRLFPAPTPYLRGDLDGDGKPDHVVVVARRSNAQTRIAVIWGKADKPTGWFPDGYAPVVDRWSWYVHAIATKMPVGLNKAPAPKLKAEAVVVHTKASAVIYWAGDRFVDHRIEAPAPPEVAPAYQ